MSADVGPTFTKSLMTRLTHETGAARSTRYSGVSLCPEPKVDEWCFKVQRYAEGAFEDAFHEHVPRDRINSADALVAIRVLVATFTEFTGSAILAALLNAKGKTPANSGVLRVHVGYPEPGVVRKACGGNVLAWVDEVVRPEAFSANRAKRARSGATELRGKDAV